MGLFKSIGRAFRKCVETVGDFFGSEKISNAGRRIQEACSEKIASEKSYDKTEANIYTTDRLNEILVSFSEGYFQQATTIENSAIKYVEEYYSQLISEVVKILKAVPNTSNLNALKNGKKRISNVIIGSIKNPLAKRMSIDDSECLSILKMDSGFEKKEAMTKFSSKVINEAIENLIQNVRNVLKDQTDDIEDYLCNISESQEKDLKNLKVAFDNMISSSNLEQIDREKTCVQSLVVIECADLVLSLL